MAPLSQAAGPAAPVPPTDPAPRLLRDLSMVTLTVPEVGPVAAAWQTHLGFRIVGQGTVSGDLAEAWGAPAAAGQPYCLLGPASGEACFVRLIAGPGQAGAGPPVAQGWNALELLVTDVDGLAARLQHSPFRRLGGPGDLYPRPRAPRAMQCVGPAGELIYFTRLLPGGSRYGLKQARSAVDRVFIVTVGGPSSDAMEAFYGARLGLRIMDRTPFINPILAWGCGVAPDTVFPTSIAPIPGRRFLVEMDECPARLPPRPRPPGGLPAGMAMVSFRVADLAAVPGPFRGPAVRIDGLPYGPAGGRRVAVIEGAAGEWLELIEGDPT